MSDEPRWTLDELCDRAATALEEAGADTQDGRVRDVPDRRTLRYYTTLGLLDRPAEMRGRTAYYGRKHLWQILAIKRLQARGSTLTQVQQTLLGLGEEELRRLAGQPEQPGAKRQRKTESADFWKAASAPVAENTPARVEPKAVRLEEHVLLLIEALRELRDEDSVALRQAAEPLLELLKSRGIIGER